MKKSLLIILVLIPALAVRAQENSVPSITFDHLALSVKDVNRSAEFYKSVLHLKEITNRTEVEGVRWFSLGEGKELHLVSVLKEDVILNKAVHFALTTDDFDPIVKILESMNIVYSDWPGTPNKITIRADGIKQIYFEDPDGNWVEINSVRQES